jgi:uncharacterized protein YjbI with pentapeptide repeats
MFGHNGGAALAVRLGKCESLGGATAHDRGGAYQASIAYEQARTGELFEENRMGNPDHLAQLKKGVAAWNTWRQENPDIHPDLSEANLRDADLHKANLTGANLYRADIMMVRLAEANLSKANLRWANCREAYLGRAVLKEADLRDATLVKAIFLKANLAGADLREANLFKTNFSEGVIAKKERSGINPFTAMIF